MRVDDKMLMEILRESDAPMRTTDVMREVCRRTGTQFGESKELDKRKCSHVLKRLTVLSRFGMVEMAGVVGPTYNRSYSWRCLR